MNDRRPNILIICPAFHGYEKRIVSCIQLSKKYKHVFFIDDAPIKPEKLYLIIKNIVPRLSVVLLKVFNKRIIRFLRNKSIDTLFIIKGTYIFGDTISAIKREYPKMKIVLYEWDSIRSNPNALSLLDEIKESYTFDIEDAQKDTRFNYHPLFYSFDQLPEQMKKEKDIDFLLVCAFSLDRVSFFLKIKELCENNNWTFKYHLYVPYGVYVKYIKLMRPYKGYISFHSLNYSDYYSFICRSKVVVDIVSPSQTGLTIRTIEALSQDCHLLTTNKNIVDVDFYKDSNITIFDINNVSSDVLNKALVSNFDKGYNKTIYSTEEWLKKMAII